MTPVTGWNEHDYYRASRAARKAWQATNQQLDLRLEETDAARGEASASVSSSRVGLSPGDGRDNRRRHAPPPGSKTTTGPDRHSPEQDGQAQRRPL